MPERLRQDIAVTHFFNPVKIMRLIELIPGSETNPEVINSLAAFVGGKLGKGVVYAKDTVNFIGNRIGCFWMMSGLHYAQDSLSAGISMEQVDALMSQPCRVTAHRTLRPHRPYWFRCHGPCREKPRNQPHG